MKTILSGFLLEFATSLETIHTTTLRESKRRTRERQTASKGNNGWLCVGSETIFEIPCRRRYKSIRMFDDESGDQKSEQLAGIYFR